MRPAVALTTASAVLLIVALWIVWPSSPGEQQHTPVLPFVHKSEPPPPAIDPPFGFHWADSMAHVEALLGYSSAEIVSRMATGRGETWIIEGLIQPGLKTARFVFENNALTSIELQCQYDEWPAERYRKRLEELRAFYDARFGQKEPATPISSNTKPPRNATQQGYMWRLGQSSLAVLLRTELAASGRRLSVSELIIRYYGTQQQSETAAAIESADPWSSTILSPTTARKVQPDGEVTPAGSDFGITGAKLLNTSDRNQTAYALQLAVSLHQEGGTDPMQAQVEVNFYDTLPTGEIVLTDAQVSYDWPSRRDWKLHNPETLTVTYIRKIGESPPNSSRKFYGYIAAVYYDGRLESVRAEPAALVNLFSVRTVVSAFEIAQSAAGRGDYVTAANLYRRAAEAGNLFALENLAWFYVHGKGVQKDYRQAAIFYERASLQNTPRSLNALAWFLATCEDNSIRNGPEAVRHATTACELTYWREWKYIDTLAAAWAESGDFKRAIEYEQQALALKDLDESARKKLEDRLALYRKRQPVRE